MGHTSSAVALACLAACGSRPAVPPPSPSNISEATPSHAPACLPIPKGTYICDGGRTMDDLMGSMDGDKITCRTEIENGMQVLVADRPQAAHVPARARLEMRDGAPYVVATAPCADGSCDGDLSGPLELTDAFVYNATLRGRSGVFVIRLEHTASPGLDDHYEQTITAMTADVCKK